MRARQVSLDAIAGQFSLLGDISPSQITSNQNDYNPTGLATASILRLSTDASRDITGLAGGADGRVVSIVNVGSFDLVLKDEAAGSTAANRFALLGDTTLAPDETITLQYDSTSSRWRAYQAADASTTVAGVVELATTTEAITGTDTVRAVTPAGVFAATSGYTTTATAAGTTTLTVSSNPQQLFTGATTQNCDMPVASTLQLGQSWLIVNNSTGAVTVRSSGGNTIVVLAGGTWAVITCILTSGTTAASWNVGYNGVVVTSAKKLSVSNSLTLAGTDGTTMTFPSTSATIARTDAANTFTGTQTFSGLIDVTNGQIAFPATQNASAGANTLDDYEEGTFTPGITFGGAAVGLTYSEQTGRYTKIGNRCCFSARTTLSAKGSSTGSALMTSLPFTSANSTPISACAVAAGGFAAAAATWLTAVVGQNTTSITLRRFATGTATTLADTDFAATSDITVSGDYPV